MRFGAYRIFLIVVGAADHALLVFGLERTRFGAQVRASVDNQRVAQGLGLDVDRIFAVTFALGSGLAGLGGALAIEIVGLDPSFGFHYLVYVLIVVAVGGLGSIAGSFVGAALARHRRRRRQVFRAGDRLLPDLPAAGGDPLRASARPVRKAVTSNMIGARAHSEPHSWLRRQSRWSIFEIAFWLAALLPFFLFPTYLTLASQIAIAALFAISVDLVLGYAGIVTLGHAMFFGLGAYAAGLISKAGWGEPLTGLVACRRALPGWSASSSASSSCASSTSR